MMLAVRIFLPFASITISTRERAGFRDHVLPISATKISAGVNVGIGGHTEEEQRAMHSLKFQTAEVLLKFIKPFWNRACSQFIPTISTRICYENTLCNESSSL